MLIRNGTACANKEQWTVMDISEGFNGRSLAKIGSFLPGTRGQTPAGDRRHPRASRSTLPALRMARCLDRRQARDIPGSASKRLSPALAMEIEAVRQASQTGHSGIGSDSPTLHVRRLSPWETRSFPAMDDLRTESRPGDSGLRLLHRGDRFVSGSLGLCNHGGWHTPDCSPQCHRASYRRLDAPAVPRSHHWRTTAALPYSRPGRHLFVQP